MDINLKLPFPPSVNMLYANSAKGRRKTKKYKQWIEDAGMMINMQRVQKITAGHRWGPFPITAPVELTINLAKKDNRRRDVANLEKGVGDLLVKMGILSDDSLIHRNIQQWFIPWPMSEVDKCRAVPKFEHCDCYIEIKSLEACPE